MGSGVGGLYSANTSPHPAHSAEALYQKLDSWSKREISKLEKISRRQRDMFKVACVVIDTKTGKRYYGRNKGMFQGDPPPKKNPILFGDGKTPALLPPKSLNRFPIGNCAEVHAVNKALNAGAKLGNLYMTTIDVTKGKYGILKKACENCTHTFKGHIKKNYAGWEQ